MLTALMDGRALTVSELAVAAGVTLQTASGHLAKLNAAKLLTAEKQGRHRYFRLSGSDIAQILEMLMGLAQRTGAVRVRTGPKDTALRASRICYDHLAGETGVQLFNGVLQLGLLAEGDQLCVTEKGRQYFSDFGIDLNELENGRRPLCRYCLDWSERRNHLGGALGAAILTEMISRKWLRISDKRALTFSSQGVEEFRTAFLSSK